MARILTVLADPSHILKASLISSQLRERYPQIDERLVVVNARQGAQCDAVVDMPVEQSLGDEGHDGPAAVDRLVEQLIEINGRLRPDLMLAYGDHSATVAAALASAECGTPLAHVEAGERGFRRHGVPEESRRVIVDHASALCLAVTQRGLTNLRRESMGPERARFVGDPLFDLFYWARNQTHRRAVVTPSTLGLDVDGFNLATLHRAHLSAPESLCNILDALDRGDRPTVLTLSPGSRRIVEETGWRATGMVRLVDRLGYFDYIAILVAARLVITDSGAIMREAFFARKPCVVPLANTWWPQIIETGWAIETESNVEAFAEAISQFTPPQEAPEGMFGDGHAAERIANELESFLRLPSARRGSWHPHGAFAVLPRPHFTPFSYRYYRGLIRRFRDAGYTFSSFDDAPARFERAEPFVLFRHDIDLDLRRALKLAEVEAAEDVQSTFFFLLRTDHYNMLSAEGSDIVRRILALGHHLGLHFDVAAYPEARSAEDLARACAAEVAVIEAWFGRKVRIVSYHRPNALVLTGDPAISRPLPHAYMELYTKRIRYLSDSGGRWREGDPTFTQDFLERRPIQVLTHPIWWDEIQTAPYQSLQGLLADHQAALERSIARNSATYRVGWLAEDFQR